MQRKIVSVILIIAALAATWYAASRSTRTRRFENPIAYTAVGDSFYVVEKEENTILEFLPPTPGSPLTLKNRCRIETNDPDYFYMIRHLYPAPEGVMVHSFVYDKTTTDLVGYRFRSYRSFQSPPEDIFTVFLENPEDSPEITYACDGEGNHYFANNCRGQRNIWKLPAGSGEVVMEDGHLPRQVEELGWTNQTSTYWLSIHLDPDGRIFAAPGETGRISEFSPRGERLAEDIGKVGFQAGRILSPEAIFHLRMPGDEKEYLTVASAGNRTWVQFDSRGKPFRVIDPMKEGYPEPDIRVGRIFQTGNGRLFTFDLPNKCLLLPAEGFGTVSTYSFRDWNRTFVLYGLALAALLGVIFYPWLARLPERLRFPFFLKLLLLFVPVVIGGVFASDWVREIMEEELVSESTRRSANLAWAIYNNISLEDLEEIQEPDDRESPAYERIFKAARRVVDREKVNYTPKWIIHKIRKIRGIRRYFFGINIWRGPIYEPFFVPRDRPEFFEVLNRKECASLTFSDDQGEWFSFLCPIRNQAGEVIYVIELYRSTEQMKWVARAMTRRVWEVIAGISLVITLLVLFFSYLFTRPLKKLIRGTKVVSRGDFDYRFDLRSRDEVGDLARAFDRMVIDLKQYTRRLAETTAEKEKIESELRLARELQQGILPHLFPPEVPPENVEIFASMEPAREVGGDFYDFFLIDDKHIGVVIADVAGKGVPAGLFMMVTRALLRTGAAGNLSAAATLAQVNRLLCLDNTSCTFVTLFYLVCDLETGKISYCNAGHNPPLIIGESRVKLLKLETGAVAQPALGIVEDPLFHDDTLELGPGETVLLYTDGVTEATGPRQEMFGEEGLVEFVSANRFLSNRELCSAIFRELALHGSGRDPFDDITILLFKWRPG